MNLKLLFIALATLCLGCLDHITVISPYTPTDFNNGNNYFNPPIEKISSVKSYDDVRWKDLSGIAPQLDSQIISTLWFNQRTVWPDTFSPVAATILNEGMNPGLGIRGLHQKGITGKNVNVAIIDQNLCRNLDHIEYFGKIVEYHDVGCNQPATSGSMHAPAVTSLLVGTNVGTAPEANVYFAAAPSWTADAQYQADALNWIVDENAKLPENNKIRVVSISAAPSGPGSPFTKNQSSWDAAYSRAMAADILVLDCTTNHGITAACYYAPENPDDISLVTVGYPNADNSIDTARLCVPNSCRTQAEEYNQGEIGYQYTGQGGLSWTIPYLAGVLAMGWQIRPELSNSVMLSLLFKSAYIKNGSNKIINPVAFIDSVSAYGK